MSFIRKLEEWDADHGIPRPASAPHLTAYHAAIKLFSTGGEMSAITAALLYYNSYLLNVSGDIFLFFVCGMAFAVLIALAEAMSLLLPYYRISERETHGAQQWATPSYLKGHGA